MYVYDTGSEFYGKDGFDYKSYISHGLKADYYGAPCGAPGVYNTDQVMLIRIFLHRLFHSKTCPLVTDPTKAQVFFVPMYPGKHASIALTDDLRSNSGIVSIGKMSSQDWVNTCKAHKENPIPLLPYLNNETAPFHFFMVSKSSMYGCDGWFRYPVDPLIKQAVRLAYGTTYIGRNESGTSDYKPCCPYEGSPDQINLLEDHEYSPHALSIPYPSSIHWSSKHGGMKAPWQFPPNSPKRPYLVSFTGSFRDCLFGHIRPVLEKAFHNCPEDVCISTHGGHCNFISTKMKSIYCLEPGGDSPWRKSLYDSITSGCIPVIFSKYNLLVSPWHWGPLVHNASVYIDAQRLISGEVNLIEELQSISKERRKAMQRTISELGHALQYSLDDYPNDAVEIILKGVHRYGKMRSEQSILDL